MAPLDAPLYGRAVRGAAAEGDRARVAALATAGGDAWLARIARAFADPDSEGPEGALLALRFEAFDGLRSLRVLGRLATSVGLLGALGALLWLSTADHGLTGLAAGLPEAMARGWAVEALARGFATGLFAAGAATLLGRRARSLLGEARALADALDAPIEQRRVDPLEPPVLESHDVEDAPFSSELRGASAVSPSKGEPPIPGGVSLDSPEDPSR